MLHIRNTGCLTFGGRRDVRTGKSGRVRVFKHYIRRGVAGRGEGVLRGVRRSARAFADTDLGFLAT